ncbi:MAG: hypothetical protein AAF146_10415 [Bacteroidota bacterium]
MTNKSKAKVIALGVNPTESEIVDTIGDVLETAAVVEDALGDGFQVSDIFRIADQEDEVRDVIDSLPQFFKEFSDINPEIAQKAVQAAEDRAKAKVGGPLGKISNIILFLLRRVSSNYAFLLATVEGGKNEIDAWRQWRALVGDAA